MKFKLILTLLFPLFLSAQNTTFESVFQTVEQSHCVEIYHAKIEVSVSQSRIEVYSIGLNEKKEPAKILIFNFGVNMLASDENTYRCTDENGSSAVFIKNSDKLTITNSFMEWVIYGDIPNVVKINK